MPEIDANASPKSSSASSRRSLRLFVMWLLAAGSFVAAAALALELFVARRLPELTAERLANAEALWQAKGPASYDLDLEILGERPGPVHVEVRDGEATSVSVHGQTPPLWTRDTWTVAGQFKTLHRELELAEDPVHQMGAKTDTQLRLKCEFDVEYGFPREFHRIVYGGGPNVYWRVTRFAAK
jgi:hypothetical protein